MRGREIVGSVDWYSVGESGWRNWQTRTFEGRVGNRTGSSPVLDTKKPQSKKVSRELLGTFFGVLSVGSLQ